MMLRKLMNLGFSFPLSSTYLFTFRGPAIYDKKLTLIIDGKPSIHQKSSKKVSTI